MISLKQYFYHGALFVGLQALLIVKDYKIIKSQPYHLQKHPKANNKMS